MPRFFVPEAIEETADRLTLSVDDSHHILHVLRLKPATEITVCDGSHTLHTCCLDSFPGQGEPLSVRILERYKGQAESPFRITLYQGLPKGDKMGLIVRMAVELGVARIVPVLCDRSVSRPDGKKGRDKAERWQKVAAAAAKQSGRDLIPQVLEPVDFATALEALSAEWRPQLSPQDRYNPAGGDVCERDRRGEEQSASPRSSAATAASAAGPPALVAESAALPVPAAPALVAEPGPVQLVFAPYEGEGQLSLKTWLRGSLKPLGSDQMSGDIYFFIGPEGGFSGREVSALAEAGVATVSLGNRILRTETAAAAVLSMLSYELELA